MKIASTHSSPRIPSITKEHLAQIWGIGLNTAAQTIKVPTHKKAYGTPYIQLHDVMQPNKADYNIINLFQSQIYSWKLHGTIVCQ
jgi:hypothetical protein